MTRHHDQKNFKFDSFVSKTGTMTTMAGNMTAGRHAVTLEHELSVYSSPTNRRGKGGDRLGLVRAFDTSKPTPVTNHLQGYNSKSFLNSPPAANQPFFALVSCKPLHSKVVLKVAEK